MIFVESDNGYKKTDLRDGDAVVFFTDVKRVVFWRGNKSLFWSPLSELPELLCPVMDIKLFYDLDGGSEEFKEKAILFAVKHGFKLEKKEMSFGRNILGKDIPCIIFEFILV